MIQRNASNDANHNYSLPRLPDNSVISGRLQLVEKELITLMIITIKSIGRKTEDIFDWVIDAKNHVSERRNMDINSQSLK